jgi:hypothetical protein
MTRVLTALAMSTFFGVLATTSSAQDDQGQMVRGMGALGCDVLVDTLQGKEASDAVTRLIAWLSGHAGHAGRRAVSGRIGRRSADGPTLRQLEL